MLNYWRWIIDLSIFETDWYRRYLCQLYSQKRLKPKACWTIEVLNYWIRTFFEPIGTVDIYKKGVMFNYWRLNSRIKHFLKLIGTVDKYVNFIRKKAWCPIATFFVSILVTIILY